MTEKRTTSTPLNIAAIIIILAGLKLSQVILLPILLALFISTLSIPLLFFLIEKKVPTIIAILLIISIISFFGLGIAFIIGTSANDFSQNLPFYEEELKNKLNQSYALIESKGFNIQSIKINEIIKPSTVIQFISSGFTQIGNILTKSFLILLIVIFILLEATTLFDKLKTISLTRKNTLKKAKKFIKKVNQYMLIKTTVSLITGTIITIFLTYLDIHYPVLWGFLAFLLNFVPNIGSILAAIPVVILAFIQFNITQSIVVLFGFIIVNFVIGNLIEPRFMGKGLGMSPLIVFISLLFWGWVFGPVGMLLAIPLTMMVKIGLESDERTHWISILIGSESEVPAPKKSKRK